MYLYKDTIFRKQGGIMSKKEPLEVIEQIGPMEGGFPETARIAGSFTTP